MGDVEQASDHYDTVVAELVDAINNLDPPDRDVIRRHVLALQDAHNATIAAVWDILAGITQTLADVDGKLSPDPGQQSR